MLNVSRNRVGAVALLGLAGFAIIYPRVAPAEYFIFAAALTVMYVALATSWNLMAGFTGYVSLGHAAFFGIGAYFTGLFARATGVDPFLAAILAGPFVAVIAAAVGYVALRSRGASFVIVTIALVYIAGLIAQGWRDFTGGSRGLSLPRLATDVETYHVPFYYAFLILAVVVLFVWWWISRSKFGMGLKAIRDDEDKAEALGVPTTAFKVLAFALSALFVGIGGGIYAYWNAFIDPIFLFSILVSAYMVLMSLLGGTRHLFGPLVGAVVIIQLNELMLTQLGATQAHLLATGLILGFVVLLMPDGIIPALRDLLRRREPPAASIREEAQELS